MENLEEGTDCEKDLRNDALINLHVEPTMTNTKVSRQIG